VTMSMISAQVSYVKTEFCWISLFEYLRWGLRPLQFRTHGP